MVTAELVEGHKPIGPPAGVPVWDVDPYDATTLAEPSGYYAELRHIGPFAYIPRYSALFRARLRPVRCHQGGILGPHALSLVPRYRIDGFQP